MAEKFDVTIIGSGPGGYVSAVRAAQLGLKVALIEREKDERLGGTCGLRGCIPTKALLNAAHLYQKAGEFEHFGLKVKDLGYDWAGVQKYKSDVVAKNSSGVGYLMKKNKVTILNGHGKILGKGKVEVALDGGKKETTESKNIIIATGSVVRPIPGFETDGKQVVNSDHILELTSVPKSMIVMGSGAVGVEFA
ncbi:MAG: FAD-dependent oxidoreductase, partial [Acidobacteria bacterium]|nr:FAD-dependent oxidoreductase [Acidobacteriota bacterium]MCA1608765.1 FAD-dependent oxidoreductase [Acidobacteriota bacterium]